MNALTAVRFRLILSVLLVLTAALVVGGFLFGYQFIRDYAQEVGRRQADADASESTITSLVSLQRKLDSYQDIRPTISGLRSSNPLPQFDAERSVRAITGQLGISIENVTFIDAPGSSTGTDASSQPAPSPTTPVAAPVKSGAITFTLAGPISYQRLLELLHALETSIPKLTVHGVTIPEGSTLGSVDPGTITIEIATI